MNVWHLQERDADLPSWRSQSRWQVHIFCWANVSVCSSWALWGHQAIKQKNIHKGQTLSSASALGHAELKPGKLLPSCWR